MARPSSPAVSEVQTLARLLQAGARGQVMARILLVVLGVLVLVAALPFLSMSGMMGAMMGGGGMTWGMGGFTLLLIAAGVALVVLGLRQRT